MVGAGVGVGPSGPAVNLVATPTLKVTTARMPVTTAQKATALLPSRPPSEPPELLTGPPTHDPRAAANPEIGA